MTQKISILLGAILLSGCSSITQPAEDRFPLAKIKRDQGGPVAISGEVAYTYPFFTLGVAEPIVILEDQGGFVTRDRDFLFPPESQVLGQITTDFFASPFSYSLALPAIPKGTLSDVDQDDGNDKGVMVFAVAYWTNTWGDPFLERRDQGGGGWSSAYASTRVSNDRANFLEIYGGKLLVYAPDDQQGFPKRFGDDGKLFTSDDPIVQLPAGWTTVDLDEDPFVFDRSREVEIDLLEPEDLALDDFSGLSYTEAFDAMLEKMRQEYAFTEHKGIDWDALAQEFRPAFERAEQASSQQFYHLSLRDFLWSIPDGHIGMSFSGLIDQFRQETVGGLGIAITELDDGTIVVVHLVEGAMAQTAGIQLGAEILSLQGRPIDRALDETVPWSSPFSTAHELRLEQLVYALRFPDGTLVEIEYRNPGAQVETGQLIAIPEFDSFSYSALRDDLTGFDLPVQFDVLEEQIGYVQITDFADNQILTIQLWERMIEQLNEDELLGLIIDLRINGGGSGFLADQMAAYFFQDELELGNSAHFDESIGEFYADPEHTRTFIPPREALRYAGPIVVIVGPACSSACEFFAYDLTLQDRATILGYYPTGGLGGSVEDFLMPEDVSVRFTVGRAMNAEGIIHIEGSGVAPDIRLPVTLDVVAAEHWEGRDLLLEQALQAIRNP
jgi:C-terminal processing protease CtpA/Prc